MPAEFNIASLMNTSINELPERKKLPPGRYEGILKVAKYDPEAGHKVFLALQAVRDMADSGADMASYDNAMISWDDKTPPGFLEDLSSFFRAHKFREGTQPYEVLEELVGRKYSFSVIQDRKNPQYTNVRNIRPVD